MTIERRENDHPVYYCNGCDQTFYYEEPMKGFKFLVGSSYAGARFDDDNDFFIEGSKKVITGIESYGCHNDEYPCFLNEGDWTVVKCEMLVCTDCGEQFTFDNDYCTEHGFSSEADAVSAAKRHEAANHGAKVSSGEASDVELPPPLMHGQVGIGDRVRVSSNGADGCGWNAGDIVEVFEIGSSHVRARCVLSAHGNEGSEWNIRYPNISMHEPKIDDELANKFVPKKGEKKVRYIDL